MKSTESLKLQREVLLQSLQVRRLAFAEAVGHERTAGSPRSVTMRFIVNHPTLCLWVVGECLPLVLTTLFGKAGKRFAKALRADRR